MDMKREQYESGVNKLGVRLANNNFLMLGSTFNGGLLIWPKLSSSHQKE